MILKDEDVKNLLTKLKMCIMGRVIWTATQIQREEDKIVLPVQLDRSKIINRVHSVNKIKGDEKNSRIYITKNSPYLR